MRSVAWLVLALLAGCSGAETASPDEASPPAAPAEPVVPNRVAAKVLPFDEQGHLGTGACVPTGTSSCAGGAVTPQQSHWLIEQKASAWTVQINMTWSPTSAQMETLSLTASPYRSCGSVCYESVGDGLVVAGTSPLSLADVIEDVPADAEGLWIGAQVPGNLPVLYGHVSVEQDIALAGTLMVR